MFIKSKLSAFSLCTVLTISVFSGCNINNITTQSPSTAVENVQSTTAVQTEVTDDDSADDINIQLESTTPNTALFADIYDEYTEELVSITPVLISEFNDEAEAFKDGNNTENLLEQKKEELTDIFNEGLAKFVIAVGDTGANDDEYEFWHDKLEDVYDAQVSELISNCAAQNDIQYGEDMDY